jgi:hypothetical protein
MRCDLQERDQRLVFSFVYNGAMFTSQLIGFLKSVVCSDGMGLERVIEQEWFANRLYGKLI